MSTEYPILLICRLNICKMNQRILALSRVSLSSERSHPEAQGVDTVQVGEHSPTLGLDTEVVLGSIRHQDAVT